MIYLGADHGGFELKEHIKKFLDKNNIEYADLGPEQLDNADDYPDFALKVANKVKDPDEKGILVCGSGIGMCMTANKVNGVRAAAAYDENTSKLSREHNNANVLCLGERTTSKEEAEKTLPTVLPENEANHFWKSIF